MKYKVTGDRRTFVYSCLYLRDFVIRSETHHSFHYCCIRIADTIFFGVCEHARCTWLLYYGRTFDPADFKATTLHTLLLLLAL